MRRETEPALIQDSPVSEASTSADQFPEPGLEHFNIDPAEMEEAWRRR
jgi:hypothetical protein